MSVQALTQAFALRGLSPSEKLVLLALANYANERLVCWPSQETLSGDTELSARTVWGALQSLEGKGVISRTPRKRADGTRSTDVVQLHFQPLANSASGPARKSCENHSQTLRKPLAAVASPTTFEPSLEEPSKEEPLEVSVKAAASTPRTPSGFDDFWKAYPRRVGKGDAKRAYARAAAKLRAEKREPLATILAALDRVKPTWDEPEFIPHAATWLNGERWDDEPELPMPLAQAAPLARQVSLRTEKTVEELAAEFRREMGAAS